MTDSCEHPRSTFERPAGHGDPSASLQGWERCRDCGAARFVDGERRSEWIGPLAEVSSDGVGRFRRLSVLSTNQEARSWRAREVASGDLLAEVDANDQLSVWACARLLWDTRPDLRLALIERADDAIAAAKERGLMAGTMGLLGAIGADDILPDELLRAALPR